MSTYAPQTTPIHIVSSPTLIPSNWKTLAINDTIGRLEEEEQHWLQQNRRNNKFCNREMDACSSQPSSPSENYNVFGLKFWKWNISLKIPASTGVGTHHKLHDLHEQYGPHHCPLKKEKKENDIATKGSKRDSQWEFFGFGNGKREGGARQAIKNRAKSIANIYYKPIDDQQDYEGDNESDDSGKNDRLQNRENIYAEIEDDVYHMWSPETSDSKPESKRVSMEPFPTIQHVTRVHVPPIPPKSPIRRNLLVSNETTPNPPPPKLLPPYPSSVVTKKSRRKSLNIDGVDGKLKRRHSIKN